MRVASFFSGIGGFDLGLEYAGMQIVFQCEINSFSRSVLRKHWPDTLLHNDIAELQASEIPDSDLWCAGFPCQDVSSANQGKRKGLEGDRSGLFYQFTRLIEQRQSRPKWVIMENVPGLLNSKNGEDFRAVLQRLDELRYGVAWRVLDAKFFGIPQRRRRVFLIASLNSPRAFEIFFADGASSIAANKGGRQGKGTTVEIQSSNQQTAFDLERTTTIGSSNITIPPTQEREKGQEQEWSSSDSSLYSIQNAAIGRKHSSGPQGRGYRNDGETWTLDSRGGADALCSTNDPFRVREVTGLPGGVDSSRYRSLGNAVAVPVIEWLGKRIMAVEAQHNHNQLADQLTKKIYLSLSHKAS